MTSIIEETEIGENMKTSKEMQGENLADRRKSKKKKKEKRKKRKTEGFKTFLVKTWIRN
jgi:hypothetical protein